MSLNLDEYFLRREKLIAEDREQRIDANHDILHLQSELNADQVVRDIRAQEATNVWGSKNNLKLEVDTHLYPGMAFLTGALHLDDAKPEPTSDFVISLAREIITKTQIFKIMSRVSLIINFTKLFFNLE
jgi:adenosine deaminase CECR1